MRCAVLKTPRMLWKKRGNRNDSRGGRNQLNIMEGRYYSRKPIRKRCSLKWLLENLIFERIEGVRKSQEGEQDHQLNNILIPAGRRTNSGDGVRRRKPGVPNIKVAGVRLWSLATEQVQLELLIQLTVSSPAAAAHRGWMFQCHNALGPYRSAESRGFKSASSSKSMYYISQYLPNRTKRAI